MRKCPSFPGYSVDDFGQVFTNRKRIKKHGSRGGTFVEIIDTYSKRLKEGTSNKKGYLTVSVFCANGKNRPVGVHELIADAYLGPRPRGLQIRHLDGNNRNNSPSNLAYGTAFENAQDRKAHGTYLSGENHTNAKLNSSQVFEIRSKRDNGSKVDQLAKEFNVSKSTIESVIYNKSYRI